MSMTMNSYHKYINSPAQIFKIRMQLKAEVNDLRKTFEAVVGQKTPPKTPNKKHFAQRLYTETTLMPQEKLKKPMRKNISPSPKHEKNQTISYSGKRQFENLKNTSSISQLLKFDQRRKKSVSPAFTQRSNRKITQTPNQRKRDPLRTCSIDNLQETPQKTAKRILPQHHQYDRGFLLG